MGNEPVNSGRVRIVLRRGAATTLSTAVLATTLISISPQTVAAADSSDYLNQVTQLCYQYVPQVLPKGWKLQCDTTTKTTSTVIANQASGVVNVYVPYFATNFNDVYDKAAKLTGHAPQPIKFTTAQKNCQKIVNQTVTQYSKMLKTKWFIRCLDGSEMPKADGTYNMESGTAWGLNYADGKTILISSDAPPKYVPGIVAHEWAHALNATFPAAYKKKLEKQYKMRWSGYVKGDYYNVLDEVFAQSFAECRGDFIQPSYKGVNCAQLKKIYAGGGVKVSFGKNDKNTKLPKGKRSI